MPDSTAVSSAPEAAAASCVEIVVTSTPASVRAATNWPAGVDLFTTTAHGRHVWFRSTTHGTTHAVPGCRCATST